MVRFFQIEKVEAPDCAKGGWIAFFWLRFITLYFITFSGFSIAGTRPRADFCLCNVYLRYENQYEAFSALDDGTGRGLTFGQQPVAYIENAVVAQPHRHLCARLESQYGFL